MSTQATPPTVSGHCACGSVRYAIELRGELPLSMYCHCSTCQRFNGAPFVHSLHIPYEWLTWTDSTSAPPPGIKEELLRNEEERRLLKETPQGAFPAALQTFEAMPGRKWKLRCRECGCPMGSWNAGTQRWTIWRTSVARRPAAGEEGEREPIRYTGPADIDEAAKELLKATHHQFYGPWRAMDVNDGLDKWDGYKGKSKQVE